MSEVAVSLPCASCSAAPPALPALQAFELEWCVMSGEGVMGAFLTPAEAEEEAARIHQQDPALFLWVAPWPSLLMECDYRHPWRCLRLLRSA